MAHEVSDVLKRAIYSGSTERVFIVLVKISHVDLVDPILLTSDGKDTSSGGLVYSTFPFTISLPDDREGSQPEARIEIQNVDFRLIALFRSVQGPPPTIEFRLVLEDDPDRVERGPWRMELVNVVYDINSIKAAIRTPSLLSEPFPANTYNVREYVGL